MTVLLTILANIILLVAALGFGVTLKPLFPQSFSKTDHLTFTLLGGLGLIGITLFTLGQVWFSRSAILVVLLAGSVFGLQVVVSSVRDHCEAFQTPPVVPATIIASILAVTAIGGLAKPIDDMNNDSIAYHYLGPKVWLLEQVIRPVPDEVYTSFPVAIESLYAALMSLGGQLAPGFFAVTSLISILLVAAGLATRLGLCRSGVWWMSALVVTMPAVYRGAYGGFIDVLLGAFLIAAARLVFDAKDSRDYVLFGIFCGIAMACKYTAILSWILLTLCALFTWPSAHTSLLLLKKLGLASLVALSVTFPLLPEELDSVWLPHLSPTSDSSSLFFRQGPAAIAFA